LTHPPQENEAQEGGAVEPMEAPAMGVEEMAELVFPQPRPVIVTVPLPQPPPLAAAADGAVVRLLPRAPEECYLRLAAPPEPPKRRRPALPPGATAFDVLRLNARAPAMNRRSPESMVQAVHEWRENDLGSFLDVRKDSWATAQKSAFARRRYIWELVQRSIPNLEHPAGYMTTKEKEDWVAVRHDYLRTFNLEKLPQYMANIRLRDSHIKRRKRKGCALDGLV
jgi:hypothetical protein